MNNNSSLNDPPDFLSHGFIRLMLTGPKALQTVSWFPSETHRRYAVSKSNKFALGQIKAFENLERVSIHMAHKRQIVFEWKKIRIEHRTSNIE
jgi:hypothetical protein